MRATWSGYFKMGDLNIPMRLFSATKSVNPKFKSIHKKDKAPISRIAVCQKEGKKVNSDEVSKAVEYDGRLIEITDEELESGGVVNKDIVVNQFADPGDISPIYFNKPYFMVCGPGGELAYSILRQAFLRANKVAIVTYGLYDKQHLGIVRPYEGLLLLHQLIFSAEMVPLSDIDVLPLPQPSPNQTGMAAKVMQKFSMPFYISDYRNEQNHAIKELIENKAKGVKTRAYIPLSSKTTPEYEISTALEALYSEKQIGTKTANKKPTI